MRTSVGKRESTSVSGRHACPSLKQTSSDVTADYNNRVILNYILHHIDRDDRPYLQFYVHGQALLGLLDSGANKSIIGSKGWDFLKGLGIHLDDEKKVSCVVADGNRCESIGNVTLPVRLEGRLAVMTFIVILGIPHVAILGTDFWKKVGIIPDLRSDAWAFRSPVATDSLEAQEVGLTSEQQEKLDNLLTRYCPGDDPPLGCVKGVEHKIVTESEPIKSRYYPVSPVMQKHIDRELQELLELGVIERANSPWASPIVMVRKKDDSYRFCIDYRKLNAVTKKDSYPLPYISSILDRLKDAKYLSSSLYCTQ